MRRRLRVVELTPTVGAWARAVTRRTNRFGWWAMRLGAPAAGLAVYERVYAYFRWADDVVDAPGRDRSVVERFVEAQRTWRSGERPARELPERALAEALAAEPRLAAAADTMWAALAADARRTPAPLPAPELEAQVRRVGDAYLLAVWCCLGEPGAPPPALLSLSRAATRAHLLRDREVDEALGYVNRPPGPDGAPVSVAAWSASLAEAARAEFAEGRAALAQVRGWRSRALLWVWAWRYARGLERWARP